MTIDRRSQLESLCDSLRQLVSILQLDSRCQWRNHFEHSYERCVDLLDSEFSSDDLASLSSSITFAYSGNGSFSDYFPATYDPFTKSFTPIPGTEAFEDLSGRVHSEALALRIVGAY